MLVLGLLFLVVPFIELYVLIQVGQEIGALPTIGALIAVSFVGAWLVKREGVGVLRRAQARIDAGTVPGVELVDGILILLAGALLLTPGFVTDFVAILLLMPPIRRALRRSVRGWLERRTQIRIQRPRW